MATSCRSRTGSDSLSISEKTIRPRHRHLRKTSDPRLDNSKARSRRTLAQHPLARRQQGDDRPRAGRGSHVLAPTCSHTTGNSCSNGPSTFAVGEEFTLTNKRRKGTRRCGKSQRRLGRGRTFRRRRRATRKSQLLVRRNGQTTTDKVRENPAPRKQKHKQRKRQLPIRKKRKTKGKKLQSFRASYRPKLHKTKNSCPKALISRRMYKTRLRCPRLRASMRESPLKCKCERRRLDQSQCKLQNPTAK